MLTESRCSRGRQGPSFGSQRNRRTSTVSIVTQLPTKEFSANASVSDGAFNDVRAEAAVSGPLSDAVQGRVAVLYEQNDPWVTNTSPTGGNLGGQQTTAGGGFASRRSRVSRLICYSQHMPSTLNKAGGLTSSSLREAS